MADAKPIRCAVYTRKSSEEGLEQSFNSLHAQREACEAYVLSQKHEGWILVPTPYDDGGFSGGSMERPALKALMTDVDAGLIDTVVVYKVDRLTRSLADFAKMVELFDARAVSFVSVTQAFNTTTSMGRLTLNVLLSFAQFEREVTGERIRDKIAASKAKGMWMGGAVPLGYDVVDRQLVVNTPEAEQVRELFQLYLDLPGVDDLVAEANARQIRSKTRKAGPNTAGGKLSRGSLYRILANPVYAGDIGHKGKTFPGQHKGIVERPLFDAVQAKLAANRRKGADATLRVDTAMLSGLVIDGEGNSLTATFTGRPGKRYRYYAGGQLRIPAHELETLVTDSLVEHLGTPAKLAPLLPDMGLLSPELVGAAAKIAADLRTASTAQRRAAAVELIQQVKVTAHSVTVVIRAAMLGLRHQLVTLVIPATVGRVRARLSLVVPGPTPARPDPSLIAFVGQARGWLETLARGEQTSFAAIAAIEGVSPDYVRNTIGAAFLAPDLVTSIVEGRQPADLTAKRLSSMLPLPASWPKQRTLFAALN